MADIDMPLAWRMMQDGYLMRINQLEAENAKLRKMNNTMWQIIMCASVHTSVEDGLPVIHEDDLRMLRNMRQELEIETQNIEEMGE